MADDPGALPDGVKLVEHIEASRRRPFTVGSDIEDWLKTYLNEFEPGCGANLDSISIMQAAPLALATLYMLRAEGNGLEKALFLRARYQSFILDIQRAYTRELMNIISEEMKAE
jgi:hypothetical protein